MTMEKGIEYRVFGAPGTGKTTYNIATLKDLFEIGEENSVLISSKTKTAARDIWMKTKKMLSENEQIVLEEDYDGHNIGTLHAICFRSLERKEIAEKKISEWNETTPIYKMEGVDTDIDGEGVSSISNIGALMLAKYNILRHKIIPYADYPQDVKHFAEKWEAWKSENKYIDFTDMIIKASIYSDAAPGYPKYGIFDEAQDFSPLELKLVRKWGAHMEWYILSGDDDQCSLPGTMVTLANGDQCSIDNLQVGTSIKSWDRQQARLRNNTVTDKECNYYNGLVYNIYTGDHDTHVTGNHIWNVKWSDEAHESNVVYLMQQGDRFRVGWCQLMNSEGACHLTTRARLEKADKVWILEVTETKQRASLLESYISAEYGIPTLCFEPVKNNKNGYITRETIDELWGMLDKESQQCRVNGLLLDKGRDFKYPLFSFGGQNQRGANIFTVRSCNLIPGLMLVPLPDYEKNNVRWSMFYLLTYNYNGHCYGLNVEKTHTYIADGIVTHNCIYEFTGACAEAFITPAIPDEQIIILPQSWRLPKKVFDFSNEWAHKITMRQEKLFHPMEREGSISFANSGCYYNNPGEVMKYVKRFTEQDKTVMILASCSYMLEPIKHELIRQCEPFHNPYRTRRADWNPIRISNTSTTTANRVLCFLQKSKRHFGNDARMWSRYEIGLWAEIMRVTSGVIKRGASKTLSQWVDGRDYTIADQDDLDEIFDKDKLDVDIDLLNDEPDVEWWLNLVKKKSKSLEFVLQVANKRGVKQIFEKPQIIIGTIHSVKGGEADSVILFPDLSREGYQQWCAKDSRDSIRRLMYVGITRAKQDLVICKPSTAMAVDFSK